MRISASRLLSDALTIDLPRAGGEANRIELSRGVNVRGVFASDEHAITLEALAADVLDAARVLYHIGTTRITSAALTLQGATTDLRIARGDAKPGYAARIGARELVARSPSVESASFTVQGAALNLHTAVYHDEGAGLGVEAGSFELQSVVLKTRAATITVASIAGTNLAVSRPDGGSLAVSAASVVLSGVSIVAGNLEAAIDRITLPKGVSWADGVVALSELTLGEAGIAVRSLGGAPASSEAAQPSPRPGVDFSFLDGLAGRIDVDVTIDAKIPVIKKRVATHKFRIPITAGTIDYKALEHDLSFLEDAVLDIELKGDRLILEKDIPLVPFDNETLVFWSLDDQERALAENHKVRLRTLTQAKLPPPKAPKKDDGKEPGFELVRVDLDPIDVAIGLEGVRAIALPGGVSVTLGADGIPGIAELRVSGGLHVRPKGNPEPGALAISAKGIVVGPTTAPVARGLSIAGVRIGEIAEGTVSFAALRPTSAGAKVRDVAVAGVAIKLA